MDKIYEAIEKLEKDFNLYTEMCLNSVKTEDVYLNEDIANFYLALNNDEYVKRCLDEEKENYSSILNNEEEYSLILSDINNLEKDIISGIMKFKKIKDLYEKIDTDIRSHELAIDYYESNLDELTMELAVYQGNIERKIYNDKLSRLQSLKFTISYYEKKVMNLQKLLSACRVDLIRNINSILDLFLKKKCKNLILYFCYEKVAKKKCIKLYGFETIFFLRKVIRKYNKWIKKKRFLWMIGVIRRYLS